MMSDEAVDYDLPDETVLEIATLREVIRILLEVFDDPNSSQHKKSIAIYLGKVAIKKQ